MFKQKLKALEYEFWDKVNANNVQHFRKLVAWLEDQKIRHYTIQDRVGLREVNSNEWDKNFEKYLADIGCPITTSKIDKLEWLVGLAVRLEYEDNVNKYCNVKIESTKDDVVPSVKSTNPLDNLNCMYYYLSKYIMRNVDNYEKARLHLFSVEPCFCTIAKLFIDLYQHLITVHQNEFKNGVKSIAQLLKIGQHPNHLVTLDACSKYVTQKLNPTIMKNPNAAIIRGKPFPINETEMGIDMGDKILNNTAKALNLLYIQDLRNLQTSINETIVTVQNITANPKTNTKAGRVGV